MKQGGIGQLPLSVRIESFVLKAFVIAAAAAGTLISAGAGRRAFMGGSRVFMYFTIQSNVAVALISLAGLALMAANARVGKGWGIVEFVGAVAITLTGVVFCFVLAPVFGAGAWNLPNVLTHVVVPVAAVADFLLVGRYRDIPRRSVWLSIVPPLAYAVYAGIGYAAKWEFADGIHYPYFFLNWGSPAGAFGFSPSLPFMGCVWWILAIFLFLLGVGRLYLALIGSRKKPLDPDAAS